MPTMIVERVAGVEESRAGQEAARKEQLEACMQSGEIGFVSPVIYPYPASKIHIGGASTLEETDLGNISPEVLGIFNDGKRDQLVVDCSGKEGYQTPRLVASRVAAILGGKEPNGNGDNWRGSFIVSLCPAPKLPEETDIRILGENPQHAAKLELIKNNPACVTILTFSK